MNQFRKQQQFERRKARVRKKILGSPSRPRLNVYRSNSHIYAQLIDDMNGKTLLFVSSRDKDIRKFLQSGSSKEAATAVGSLLAERAKTCNVIKVVFDRGGRLYHGRVKALAEASREGGLNF